MCRPSQGTQLNTQHQGIIRACGSPVRNLGVCWRTSPSPSPYLCDILRGSDLVTIAGACADHSSVSLLRVAFSHPPISNLCYCCSLTFLETDVKSAHRRFGKQPGHRYFMRQAVVLSIRRILATPILLRRTRFDPTYMRPQHPPRLFVPRTPDLPAPSPTVVDNIGEMAESLRLQGIMPLGDFFGAWPSAALRKKDDKRGGLVAPSVMTREVPRVQRAGRLVWEEQV